MATTATLSLLLLAVVAGLVAEGEAASDYYHKERVRIHVFDSESADTLRGIQILRDLSTEDILSTGYNPDLPTKILIHGFANNIKSESMQLLKDAYFEVDDKVNVIVVDWSFLCPPPLYFAGFGNMHGTAARVAEVIDFMVENGILSLDKLHIIGHSLGAHVAGITGELITSGRIARITGLDPARPLFNMNKPHGRLSEDDADLVDVIHTSGGHLGIQEAIGDVDFYPNGGKEQPGCNFDFTGACAHGRSYELMAETIRHPNAFVGYRCDDEWDAIHKRCEENDDTAIMGEHVSFSKPGAYYLETSDREPYFL